MTLKEAVELIEYYQQWRLGNVEWQVKPSQITEALNVLLTEIKRSNNGIA